VTAPPTAAGNDRAALETSLVPHRINAENNFIGGWYLGDVRICDDLIGYFNNAPGKTRGLMSGNYGKGTLDPSAKDSTDVNVPPGELATRYITVLNRVAREYAAKYSYCMKLVPWGITEPIAIQHYKPGGGFKAWHFERDNSDELIARRHLAFMTYLNAVQDGGGTSFFYQHVTFKAEKGLTLIWPVEWTHTHKGEISATEEKYIVTGWFSTYSREEYERVRQRARTRV
jgi:prolyl 4-hydroxylase